MRPQAVISRAGIMNKCFCINVRYQLHVSRSCYSPGATDKRQFACPCFQRCLALLKSGGTSAHQSMSDRAQVPRFTSLPTKEPRAFSPRGAARSRIYSSRRTGRTEVRGSSESLPRLPRLFRIFRGASRFPIVDVFVKRNTSQAQSIWRQPCTHIVTQQAESVTQKFLPSRHKNRDRPHH